MTSTYNYLLNDVGFKEKENVVVAVSGGPDSMVLLHLLIKIKEKININIVCAHVNHNVRKESYEEAKFVEKYCKDNDVIFEYMIIEKYNNTNFHSDAREIRYNFFKKIVKKYNSKYLFTAHHADDLMETILMRIVRGSTLKGYSGFEKRFHIDGYDMVRPLIEVTKEQLKNYALENNIPYVIDSSNVKDVYTRNRYRKYIVSKLKEEDINVHKKFYKFSNTLMKYDKYINKLVEKVLPDIYVDNTLNIKEFLKLDDLIATKVIEKILEINYNDKLMLVTDKHVNLVHSLINSNKVNGFICLPMDIKVVKEYNNLVFSFKKDVVNYEMVINNRVDLPNGHYIERLEKSDLTGNDMCYLDSKDIKLPLKVRTRLNGDKISVKNMSGNKKVKDIFIDAKIEASKRDEWPIVVDSNNQIIWIPNLKKSQFDKTKEQNCDIILRYY